METAVINGNTNGGLMNGHAWLTRPPSQVNDESRIELVSGHFREIMRIIGLDVNKPDFVETPKRVATMFVHEIFRGLNPDNQPRLAFFKNKQKYGKMLVEKNITVHSFCEGHFLPIIGKAQVAYMPNEKIIDPSTLSRIVQYCSAKPQVQAGLTDEIANYLKEVLQTQDIAVMIDAVHLCVVMRGVRDPNTSSVTTHFSGRFQNEDVKTEFLLAVK